MKAGIKFCLIIYLTFLSVNILANEKITTSPLINLQDLKPSFEEPENNNLNNEIEKVQTKRKN